MFFMSFQYPVLVVECSGNALKAHLCLWAFARMLSVFLQMIQVLLASCYHLELPHIPFSESPSLVILPKVTTLLPCGQMPFPA